MPNADVNVSSPAITGQPAKGLLDDFAREVKVFRELLPKLLDEMPGEYVAILNGRLVDHKPSWERLFEATREAHPDAFVLIEQVVPRSTELVDMDTLTV